MRNQEWCGSLGFLSQRPSLRNVRFLNDLSPISYPQGINREVFIGKSLKSFGFGRVPNQFA